MKPSLSPIPATYRLSFVELSPTCLHRPSPGWFMTRQVTVPFSRVVLSENSWNWWIRTCPRSESRRSIESDATQNSAEEFRSGIPLELRPGHRLAVVARSIHAVYPFGYV